MKSPIPKERLRVSNWIVQRHYNYAVNVLPVGIDKSHVGRYSNREEDQEATVARDGHAFVAERISAKCRGMGLAGRHRIELYGEGAGIVAHAGIRDWIWLRNFKVALFLIGAALD